MLRGGNEAVILYCLGFRTVFAICFMQWIAYVASCQILLLQFNAVKWSFHEQYCIIYLC